MAEHQGPRRYAFVRILVEGRDITDRVAPYLISVQVISTMNETDTCNIELDDRNAELIIPGDSAAIQVVMGWRHAGPRIINVEASSRFLPIPEGEVPFGGPDPELLFSGHLKNCESGFGRKGGGRRIWLEAENGEPTGKAKENQTDTIGEGKKRESDATETGEGGTGALGAAEAAAANAAVGAITGFTGAGPIGKVAASVANAVVGMMNGPRGASVAETVTSVTSTLTKDGFLTDSIGDKNAPKDAPGTFSEGKIPLMEAGTQFFGKAGMTLKLSPEMQKIRRNFWDINNESPQAWGQKIAREVNGIFKMNGNVATIVGKGEGVNADGQQMPTIEAEWGVNLIGWRIKPFVARPQYGSAASRYFDLDAGEWKQTEQSIKDAFPFGQTVATFVSMAAEVDKNVASQKNAGNEGQSKWEKGTGWVLFNGDPRAKANSKISIQRARPGIDGTYTMEEVEHNYQRGVGYTTRANVRAPNPAGPGGGFGNDPGRRPPPSLSNPAEPAPEPKKPGESTADWIKRQLLGTRESAIEGRYKAGFITRAEADRLLAIVRRQNFSVEEQARIKQYDQERRAGYAQ